MDQRNDRAKRRSTLLRVATLSNLLLGGLAALFGPRAATASDLFRAPQFDVQVTEAVAYGTGTARFSASPFEKTLVLDLYEPVGADAPALRPGMIVIHGGGFRVGSRLENFAPEIAFRLASRGYVAVAIDYRLDSDRPTPSIEFQELQAFLLTAGVSGACPSIPATRCIAAITAALQDTTTVHRWLVANADSLGLDPSRIAIGGSSAGAITSNIVAYAIDDHGIDARPAVAAVMPLSAGMGPLTVDMEPGEPPLFSVHGEADTTIPIGGSEALVAAADAAGIPFEFHPIPGADHLLNDGTAFFEDKNESGQTVFDLAVEFLYFHLFAPPSADIKPGSEINPINPASRGVIPVAILGSDEFDVEEVELTSLAFGPRGAAPTHKKRGHRSDVDGDGATDLLSHYRTEETGIAIGDTMACVTGETYDGIRFEACDRVTTRGCGLGFELVLALPPLLRRRARSRLVAEVIQAR